MKLELLFLTAFLTEILRAHGNYFKEIEKMFVTESGRQATNVLQEDLAGGIDNPKLITISYPTVLSSTSSSSMSLDS
jgi:hypothetical protein